jgi:hypothetical protein
VPLRSPVARVRSPLLRWAVEAVDAEVPEVLRVCCRSLR